MNRLQEIFGNKASEKEADLEAYSLNSTKPKAVVWPIEEEELRQLFRYVSRTDTTLFIVGSKTSPRIKNMPKNTIIVDLTRKNKILKVNLKEKTATVEAGIMIKDLNDFLSEHNLEFPIIPENISSTIGGMISTNATTRRSIKNPEIIDWIKEIEIMDGSGKLYTTRTVKDFVGSEGVNAIILKATLKLQEPIQKTRIQTYKFDHSLDLLEKLKSLEEDPTLISIELIEKTASALIKEPQQYILLAEYLTEENMTNSEDMKIWKKTRNIYSTLCQRGYDIIEDVKVKKEEIPRMLVWLRKNKVPAYINLGNNVIFMHFRKNQNTSVKQMYEQVRKLKGNINGCFGIGTQKKEHISNEKIEEIREQKQTYDPDNTLNRGIIL